MPSSLLFGGRILASGIKDVPTATAEPISNASVPCRTLLFLSDSGQDAANTNPNSTIRVGDSSVTNAAPGIRRNQGMVIDGGAKGTQDPSEYYCISGTATMKLSWWAIG
jgi:hypothetical protein